MNKQHLYTINNHWTGNTGTGTSGYTKYERAHILQAAGKPPISASSDPAFRGSTERYNPEELLVASLSSCHMLWYLHCCATAGITVLAYTDEATGCMEEQPDGAGQFTSVTLRPNVIIREEARIADALLLHEKAHALCFIARSVNFPVHHEAVCRAEVL
jgi:organic hydroperoxide reductase OsmC/OhrA